MLHSLATHSRPIAHYETIFSKGRLGTGVRHIPLLASQIDTKNRKQSCTILQIPLIHFKEKEWYYRDIGIWRDCPPCHASLITYPWLSQTVVTRHPSLFPVRWLLVQPTPNSNVVCLLFLVRCAASSTLGTMKACLPGSLVPSWSSMWPTHGRSGAHEGCLDVLTYIISISLLTSPVSILPAFMPCKETIGILNARSDPELFRLANDTISILKPLQPWSVSWSVRGR